MRKSMTEEKRALGLTAADVFSTIRKHLHSVSTISLHFLGGADFKLDLQIDLELDLFAPLIELIRQAAVEGPLAKAMKHA